MNRPPETRTRRVYAPDVRAAAADRSLDTCGACVPVVWMFVQLSVCIIECISLPLPLCVHVANSSDD